MHPKVKELLRALLELLEEQQAQTAEEMLARLEENNTDTPLLSDLIAEAEAEAEAEIAAGLTTPLMSRLIAEAKAEIAAGHIYEISDLAREIRNNRQISQSAMGSAGLRAG